MAVTLAQIQNNTQDDIQAGVIDEFRKSSYLLDAMTFDDAVSPGTNGGTLTYGYARVTTQPTAASRAFNSEYTAQEAAKTRETVDLKVFGGAFEIDRVFTFTRDALVDEVGFQTDQKIKAAVAKFHDLAINGDNATTATEFDGLDVILAGSDTEFGATTERDWTAVNTEAEAFAELELVDEWLSLLDGMPAAILGNRKSILRLKYLARWAGYLTQSEDAFGRKSEEYDGIELVDLGEKPGSTNPIIPIETRDPDGDATSTTGLTDLYAVRFGMDGFHGVTLTESNQLVRTYLDEFDESYQASGAVRKGEVESVSAVALRATKAAGVFRNIKVE